MKVERRRFYQRILCLLYLLIIAGPNIVHAEMAFESVIVSKFNGLDHGNIYELQNGQVWKQTEYWIWVWVWVGPKVLIYQDGAMFKMKVENIDHAVTVERIK